MRVSRAAAVLGPRQAGKSTLAKQIQASGLVPNYYSLDRDAFRVAAVEDPDGFIAGVARPAVIDEIQRAPGLLLSIKQVLDAEPGKTGQFLVTGSSNLLANRNVIDALPGRVEYVNLWPLSQGEIAGIRETFIDQLLASRVPLVADAPVGRIAHADAIVAGGFPDAQHRVGNRARGRYFDSYVKGILERDMPDVYGARTDPAVIGQLLRLLAARTSGLVNFRRLGDQLGVNQTTAKAHVNVLSQLFLTLQLHPWSSNLGSRHVRSPKVYLTDTGLASALIGVDAERYAAPDQGEVAGILLESFVLMEIVKQRTWCNRRVNLFFYRDKQQREVDVVIEDATGDIAGVEIKASASVDRSDARGLLFLRDKTGARFKAGVVLYSGSHTIRLDDRVWAVPLQGLWSDGVSNADT